MLRHFSKFHLTLTATLAVGRLSSAQDDAGVISSAEHMVPVLKEYCVDCHNPDKMKGDFDLTRLLGKDRLGENREDWEKVAEALEAHDMPPEKKPQPTAAQRDSLVKFIDGQLSKVDCSLESNPGKVTIRRLNREEYRNTIRDLLHVDFQPDDFPNDEVGYGFDNIADVLSLPPLLMEKFLAAAEEITSKAIVLDAAPKPEITRLRGDRFSSASEWIKPIENHDLGLYREGEGIADFVFPQKGEYTFRIRAYGEQAGPEAPKMALRVGGRDLSVFDVKTERGSNFEVRASVDAGPQKVAIAYLNNYNDANNPDPKLRGDRNLFVEYVEIVAPPRLAAPPVVALDAAQFKPRSGKGTADVVNGSLAFASDAEATATVNFPAKDDYLIRIRAHGDQAGMELPKLRVSLDGRELKVCEVKATIGSEDTFEIRVPADPGPKQITVAFINDYFDPANPDPKLRGDRNLWVHGAEIVGPLNAGLPNLPESHTRLIPRLPEAGRELAMAREILQKFASRAYRRPATEDEVSRLVGFVDLAMKQKGGFLEGMQVAIQAVLCSPRFLFRWELDPESTQPGTSRELSDYEVASRLSYFLWSSMPDDELTALADRGELHSNGNLEKQAVRMLNDWKARAFVNNFAGQWLQIRNIWEVGIDPDLFPRFEESLKGAMKEETERFFEAVMKENRPVTDLLDADFTFLNEKLARFYGIFGVSGDQFQRVTLPKDSARGGVLTQGSVLLATSTPTRTSPVIRGKWILEQILGTPPPPPPPDVPPLPEQSHTNQSASLRQRLEQHRSKAECAGCHALMDPLGFALENFDATGAWRDKDGTFPIDASGKLKGPSGKTFNGPRELKAILKDNKKFVHNLTEKMMTYALGRGLEYYDKCAVQAIAARLPQEGNRFGALVAGIVTSDPFLKRKRDVAAN